MQVHLGIQGDEVLHDGAFVGGEIIEDDLNLATGSLGQRASVGFDPSSRLIYDTRHRRHHFLSMASTIRAQPCCQEVLHAPLTFDTTQILSVQSLQATRTSVEVHKRVRLVQPLHRKLGF